MGMVPGKVHGAGKRKNYHPIRLTNNLPGGLRGKDLRQRGKGALLCSMIQRVSSDHRGAPVRIGLEEVEEVEEEEEEEEVEEVEEVDPWDQRGAQG
ncbi:hypothetical protein EYF80_034978 [Liparis tanakae]|uniref:Uncharacterized protein n=1 Tax=Liparis tanakae TaxID=230148 RepID=A0A4Z2GPY5_9TELE|nr:hypothetical protein EYF80_034978 [Liparis tanakae]